MARHVVADDQLTDFHSRKWELERRIREGALNIPTVCQGLQTLIEGKLVLPDLTDLRRVQAFRLYDSCGIGEELGFSAYEAYLETIPPVPAWSAGDYQSFDRVALVENRLKPTVLCRALGVRYEGTDDTFEPWDQRQVIVDPVYWILFHDGRRNRNQKVRDCRTTFPPSAVGLNHVEELCAYAQDRRKLIVENEHAMDLPGSVLRVFPEFAAILKVCDGRPELCWSVVVDAVPGSGSAARLGVREI